MPKSETKPATTKAKAGMLMPIKIKTVKIDEELFDWKGLIRELDEDNWRRHQAVIARFCPLQNKKVPQLSGSWCEVLQELVIGGPLLMSEDFIAL